MKPKVLLISGTRSRDLRVRPIVDSYLDLARSRFGPFELIVGCCPTGVDLATRLWAIRNRVRIQIFYADWERNGKRAGPIRNREMIEQLVWLRSCERSVRAAAFTLRIVPTGGTRSVISMLETTKIRHEVVELF